MKVESKSWQMM